MGLDIAWKVRYEAQAIHASGRVTDVILYGRIWSNRTAATAIASWNDQRQCYVVTHIRSDKHATAPDFKGACQIAIDWEK